MKETLELRVLKKETLELRVLMLLAGRLLFLKTKGALSPNAFISSFLCDDSYFIKALNFIIMLMCKCTKLS